MYTRREFCAAGAASALLPCACDARPLSATGYRSVLQRGFAPETIVWAGRTWRCNMGSTWNPGLDHCLQIGGPIARFELRDSPLDRSRSDPPDKRRCELSGSLRGDLRRLPNGVPLWGAMSFIHHRWADPAGMARLRGGVHGQLHIGSKFGGSPALAFRRTNLGEFQVTTRGELDPKGVGSVRYQAPVSFDEPHDLVYCVLLHPTQGFARVWLDGRQVVDARTISIGSQYAQSFWNVGCYYGSGIACPVAAEYANHVYPSETGLNARTKTAPRWPRG